MLSIDELELIRAASSVLEVRDAVIDLIRFLTDSMAPEDAVSDAEEALSCLDRVLEVLSC